MAAQSEDSRVALRPNALGALLLSRGIITEEQLDAALQKQQVSGEQLGAILVDLGFANAALIAQALATQHGSALKTEYGFATGFGTTLRAEGPISDPPLSSFPSPPPGTVSSVEPPLMSSAMTSSEPGVALSATNEHIQVDELPTHRRTELEEQLTQETQRVAKLEVELSELRAASAGSHATVAANATILQLEEALSQWQNAYAELEAQIRQAHEQVASLQHELAARDAALTELQASTTETDATHDELVRALAAEVDRANALQDQLATLAQQRSHLADSAQNDRTELEAQIRQAHEQVASLQHELAARDAALTELQASTTETDATHDKLVRALAAEVDRANVLQDQLATLAQQRSHLADSAQNDRTELERQLADVEAFSSELAAQVAAGETLCSSESISEPTRRALEMRLEHARDQLIAAERSRAMYAAELAQMSEMSKTLERSRNEAEALRGAILRSDQTASRLEDELCAAELEQPHAEPDLRVLDTEAEPPSRGQGHLVFFQGANGYELIERDGGPPAEGSIVDLPTGLAQIVQRIARSPFPADARPCAYLIPT